MSVGNVLSSEIVNVYFYAGMHVRAFACLCICIWIASVCVCCIDQVLTDAGFQIQNGSLGFFSLSLRRSFKV